MSEKELMITMPVRIFQALLVFSDPVIKDELIKALKPYITKEIKEDIRKSVEILKELFNE